MSHTAKRNIILLSLILVAALIALSAVAIARAAADRAALEDAHNRYEEGKNPTTTLPQGQNPTDGGYQRLGKGQAASMMVHYFGDDTFYGRGTNAPLSETVSTSAVTLLHEYLIATYASEGLNGRIPTYTGNVKSTNDMLYDFSGCRSEGWDIRLSIMMPSDATMAENALDNTLTGNAGTDIENLIRMIRTSAPYCDILLVVPHNASDALAAVILALGTHYGLVTVDLRVINETAGMVHTEGDDAGYPTVEGHRAIADRIAAAIADAVKSGLPIPDMPQTKLY